MLPLTFIFEQEGNAMSDQPPVTNVTNVFEKPTLEEEPPPQRPTVNVNRYRIWDKSSVLVCNDCGCLVLDAVKHDDFHALWATVDA